MKVDGGWWVSLWSSTEGGGLEKSYLCRVEDGDYNRGPKKWDFVTVPGPLERQVVTTILPVVETTGSQL